ncbi:tRNA CCA-pyrophosphorylase [Candidatus Francisella endociliophora]|uniref:tRNA CCA-pyrophosphorylase n=1 Tax=Candidatus Francisella endociliophora TaxID=653937 RepID=A0A097EPF1_9GAMM|nr:CCA tRNA nucleotidyltransferase [Francisella sp. FSC1006]AIT09440.1 tRNA CCA-pyrophosphorylase [Francisella sp. FSC1006]
MKVYLVGGAVRDILLGLEPKDKDWVVVGATEQQILEAGFLKVNASFPVFIDPKTKDEYALARSEKKISQGYHGFEIKHSECITLEEDLMRRDLTINSIAMTQDNKLVDPFNGYQDIKDRILRHTSNAFIEDPLRVVRLARFMAQLNRFKFTIATETKTLVKKVVKSDELLHLTKERLNKEFIKSLDNPVIFFKTLDKLDSLAIVFPNIKKQFHQLPNEYFFDNQQYLSASVDEKIALCLINTDEINILRKELMLTNKQTKLLSAVINVRKILENDNITAREVYYLIKNANLVRDRELFKQTFSIHRKYDSINNSRKQKRIYNLEKAIIKIIELDISETIEKIPKSSLKAELERLYIYTIKKLLKI